MPKAIKIAPAITLAGAFLGAVAMVVSASLGLDGSNERPARGAEIRGGSSSVSTGGPSDASAAFPRFGAGGFETGVARWSSTSASAMPRWWMR